MLCINCWAVEVWDGGDRHNLKFYVKTKEEAEKWKVKNPHDFIHEKNFIIFDTIEEAQENDLAKVRERVLAKLSPIERKALGLN